MEEEVQYFENFDLESIVTPVKVDIYERLLREAHFDSAKTEYLVNGFKEGFDLEYKGDRKICRTAPNLKLNVGSHTKLWNKVMKEVDKKRYAGPFESIPFKHFIQSPIGLVPKDQGKDTRLIFHLSYPKTGKSVNSETDREKCKVVYPDFNKAIQLCVRVGANACIINTEDYQPIFAGKSDMKSAFRNVPISKRDFMLLIMKAKNPKDGKIYFFC